MDKAVQTLRQWQSEKGYTMNDPRYIPMPHGSDSADKLYGVRTVNPSEPVEVFWHGVWPYKTHVVLK